MNSVKEAADKAASAVDSGLEQASSTVKTTVAKATATAQGWLAQGQVYLDTAKVNSYCYNASTYPGLRHCSREAAAAAAATPCVHSAPVLTI